MIALAAVAVVAAVLASMVAVSVAVTGPPDPGRSVVVGITIGLVGFVSVGLVAVAAQAATDGDILCPTDAQCSAPFAWPALVLTPVAAVGTVIGGRLALRNRWAIGVMVLAGIVAVVVVTTLVVTGATYRIDVPRP